MHPDVKPLVKNAANEAEVKEAGKKSLRGREQELLDLKNVLATEHGRRILWRIMGHCRTFGSVWEASARIHYNSGQQDVGHFLQAEILAADESAYLLMQKENMERVKSNG